MKVHLNQIPSGGLHVEGADSSAGLDLREPGIQSVSDVRYELDIGLSDGGLFATGTIGVDLQCQCVSCLEAFERPIEVPDFACQVELNNSETVDLTELIREDILLALPPHPHCDWNGEKVCPGPAREFKSEAATDSLPQENDVWGALDQLKLKKN